MVRQENIVGKTITEFFSHSKQREWNVKSLYSNTRKLLQGTVRIKKIFKKYAQTPQSCSILQEQQVLSAVNKKIF